MAQLASVRLSEREIPGSILGDLNVCFDFPLIRVAIALIPTLNKVTSPLPLPNYYRWFIKGFVQMASYFNKLTNKNAKFDWTPESQTSLDCVKNGLVLAPVLAYPEFKLLFHLYVDASQTSCTRFDRKLLP